MIKQWVASMEISSEGSISGSGSSGSSGGKVRAAQPGAGRVHHAREHVHAQQSH